MSAIGSLVFCTDCGNLLDGSSDEKAVLICDVCGASCRDNSSKVIVTASKPGVFPSPLSLKHHSQVQAVDPENIRTDATIKETCPNCGREEVRYYTQQLRSADEGSTVFYNCECGHKWTTNN